MKIINKNKKLVGELEVMQEKLITKFDEFNLQEMLKITKLLALK